MSGLAWLKPKFAPRYLLPSLPAFITLASIGITILIDGTQTRYCRWASIGVVITLALPLASIGSLLQLYTDPALARPDVRSVARYIEAAELPVGCDLARSAGIRPRPSIITIADRRPSFRCRPICFRRRSRHWMRVRCRSSKRSCRQHPRVWLVLWQNQISDPTNIVEDTLVADGQAHQRGRQLSRYGRALVRRERRPDR